MHACKTNGELRRFVTCKIYSHHACRCRGIVSSLFSILKLQHESRSAIPEVLPQVQHSKHRLLMAPSEALTHGMVGGLTLTEAAQDARMMEEHISPGTTSNTDPGCRYRQTNVSPTLNLYHQL